MSETINSNLRHLKVVENDRFHMKSGLCNACGNRHSCSIKSEATQLCTDYQPVIPFMKLDGMGEEFNTFRLGSAWARRVKPGQAIGLLNRQGEKIGEAVVKAVHCGDKEEMLNEHARYNHLMIAKPHDNPAAELKRLIRNMYGTNYLANASSFSVIYLKRA